MRIGVLGIGDIARKAYLPVLAALPEVELVLASRDAEALDLARRTHGAVASINTASGLGELLDADLAACFVTSATPAHFEQVSALLDAGVPVHCDKPLTLTLAESGALIEQAQRVGRLLRTGFNRRHMPQVRDAAALGVPDLVIHQKHRSWLPNDARSVVVDDFIHVLDTVRQLLGAHEREQINGVFLPDGQLVQVSVLLTTGDGRVGHAVMSRRSGQTEERLEVLASGVKHSIVDFGWREVRAAGELRVEHFGDWTPMLQRRGFETMIAEFLADVASSPRWRPADGDALATHALAGRVVQALQAG